MSVALGQQLKIRSMIYVAAEPVPYFWPMRAFIHHNPLHGLEHMPFDRAVEMGADLFHGRAYLPRAGYQRFLRQGKVDRRRLAQEIDGFLAGRDAIPGVDMNALLMALLTDLEEPVMLPASLVSDDDIRAHLHGGNVDHRFEPPQDRMAQHLRDELLGSRPVYEAIDSLYGTDIGTSLDELVVKGCLDFFDEGQSVDET